MTTYMYTGDHDRYFPGLGLLAEPGGEFELDRNPDPLWFTPPDPEPETDKAAVPKLRAAAKTKEA